MELKKEDELRAAVRDRYAQAAATAAADSPAEACCAPAGATSSCCGAVPIDIELTSSALGYSAEELASLPEGANLGLGCGNPQAIASLKPGEVVLDLGSGAGIDCFLAARSVGETGRVIGVDMTPEMLSKARANAKSVGITNVEFRLGEIEHLPVADNSVDVIISNCVINLSPEKQQVFDEAFRVLKPGGRLAVSDVVATAVLPPDVERDLALYAGCISGASEIGALERMIARAGFERVRIAPKEESREFIREWAPGRNVEDYVVSAAIEARKPAAKQQSCC